ncbi:hypothetical protein D3C78_1917070 [compost metagenome]
MQALGIAYFELINVAPVFLFQFGFFDLAAGVQGQGSGVERLERLNGARITQL